MRHLIDIFNTKDLRYLIIGWDDEEDQDVTLDDDEVELLISAFDEIMDELVEITGNKEYKEHFDKFDHDNYEKLQLTIIEFINTCMSWERHDLASEIITEYQLIKNFDGNITPEIGKRLKAKYNSIKNRRTIRHKKKKEEPDQLRWLWEDERTFILKWMKVMPEYDCTVLQFLSLKKEAIKSIPIKNEETSEKNSA